MTNRPRLSLAAAWPRALAPVLALALGACSPDAKNIEVSASILDPSLTLTPSTFGTPDDPQATLSGKFTLVLDLGLLADQAADVEPQQFVVQIGDSTSVVPPVPVAATAPKSVHVNPGERQQVVYEFTYDNPQKVKDLCQAGKQAQINGVIYEAREAETKPVTGTPFAIAGCP